jgi:hypothetical protein
LVRDCPSGATFSTPEIARRIIEGSAPIGHRPATGSKTLHQNFSHTRRSLLRANSLSEADQNILVLLRPGYAWPTPFRLAAAQFRAQMQDSSTYRARRQPRFSPPRPSIKSSKSCARSRSRVKSYRKRNFGTPSAFMDEKAMTPIQNAMERAPANLADCSVADVDRKARPNANRR